MMDQPLTCWVSTTISFLACLFFASLSQLKAVETEIPGHLKPLGQHRKHEVPGVAVLTEAPEPKDFFENFVKIGKPFLIPGFAKKIPMYQKWSDDYLLNKYGSMAVDVEVGKKENRSQSMVQTEFKNFLKYYNRSDIYLVTSVTLKDMKDEIWVPRSFLCGGFTDVIQDIVMWFSSGGTKSVLHFDGLDNFNCLLDGEKELFMVDKDVDLHLDIQAGSYSSVNVDSVDMIKYPQLRDVPWYNVSMRKGDCLFIPYRWPHQVTSSGRNLAINLWFLHKTRFNYKDCEQKNPVPEFTPVSEFEVSGGDAEQFRHEVATFVMDKPSQKISFEDFPALCVYVGQPADCDFEEFFLYFDYDEDGFVTQEEVLNVNILEWTDVFAYEQKRQFDEDEDEEGEELANVEDNILKGGTHEAHTDL